MNTHYNFDVTMIFLAWTLIFLAGTFAVFVFQKHSAAFRHGIWCATLVAVLVFPFLYPFLPPLFTTGTSDASPLESLWYRVRSEKIVDTGLTPPMSVTQRDETATMNPNMPKQESKPSGQAEEIVARWGSGTIRSSTGFSPAFFLFVALSGVYVLGMLVMIVRTVLAHGTAWLWIRRSKNIDDPEISERIRYFSTKIWGPRTLRVRRHPGAVVPFHVSIFTPTVIVPEDFSLHSHKERDAVLAHEIAHVARRDLFWQLLVQWASIPLWPHPLFWYLRARMRIEQERACDDLVLKTLGEPDDYARTLLEMAASLDQKPFRVPAVAAPIARAGSVADRIVRIFNPRLDHRPLKKTTKAMFIFAGLLVLVFAIMSVRRPDESQRLYAISVTRDEQEIPIRGKILMPDGTPPKECYVHFNYKTYHKDSWPSWSKRSVGYGENSGGKSLKGDPRFEFAAVPDSNAVLTASSSWPIAMSNTTVQLGEKIRREDVFVMKPYAFSPSKDDPEIVLHLEPASHLKGKLYYDNGEPASETVISAVYFYEAPRGADIPRVQNESLVATNVRTNSHGAFEFPLWSGAFVLAAGGTRWSPPVTKTVPVERDAETVAELTIPTPLRVNVEFPDGTPARDFRMVHLGTYAPSASGSWREVFSDELYSARTWEDDPEYAYPKQPTPVYLSNEENYLVVMTGDNKYGIVRRIAPEMMGQTMTLTLRETVAGKAKLLAHGTRKPLVENDVTVAARIMHAEYNGSFTQQLVYVGSASHFHTNREGDVAFLAPVFEGECENVFLSFREGKGGGNGMSGSTHRSGGWFPRGLLEKFRNFKPEPDGKPLDLGEFELER